MMRYAELRMIYDVMRRYKKSGRKGFSREDTEVLREIVDLEFEEKKEQRESING